MALSSICKENKDLKNQVVTYIYPMLMLVFYLGYILLERYRLSKSEFWISQKNITQEDIQSISHLGTWTYIFEVIFLALFIIGASIILFFYRKNTQVLRRFLLVNISLFITLLVISYTLSFLTTLPFGNLTQPLITPIFLLGILLIYFGFIMVKDKLFKRNKSRVSQYR